MINYLLRHKIFTISMIVVIISAFIPIFVKSPYYLDLVIITMVNAVLGMAFIMTLRTGLMNLGLAAFWGVGAYASAVFTSYYDINFWFSLPLSMITTVLIAALVGFFLIRGGASGFSFVMLSSVIGMLFSVTVGNIKYLGGYNGISNIPKPDPINLGFITIEFLSKAQYFYLALVLLVIVILVSKAFYSSWTGRAWNAINLNPRLAESLGINIFRYKYLSFLISSGILGLIGCFYAQYERYVVPGTFSMWVNVYIQIYAILGGLGYAVLGPIVGSGAYTFLTAATRSRQELTPIFLGVLLILLIMFLPYGLLGLSRFKENLKNRIALVKRIFKKGIK